MSKDRLLTHGVGYKNTYPGLIIRGGNFEAVESPEEGGESWKVSIVK